MDSKYEVIVTERAKQELKEIYDYISKSLMEENTAIKMIDKIENELLKLEIFIKALQDKIFIKASKKKEQISYI